jgi:hypothetical protein
MNWEDVLKSRKFRIPSNDKRLIDYIMRDRQPRNTDKLIDDIYDYIAEIKSQTKYTTSKLSRPYITKFNVGPKSVAQYLTNSPKYELRELPSGIRQYVYIGGN